MAGTPSLHDIAFLSLSLMVLASLYCHYDAPTRGTILHSPLPIVYQKILRSDYTSFGRGH